eukprot:jgi/Antlo1/908/1739
MGGAYSNAERRQRSDTEKFSHFPPKDIKSWSDSFYKAFPNGSMKVQDLERQLKCFFPFGDSRQFSKILFRTINISGTDTIDFHEMLIAFSILTKGSNFEKLRWIFRFYDCDNDGVVSRSEMMHATKALFDMVGTTFDLELDAETSVDMVFRELENRSGFLTFDDFRAIATKKKDVFALLTVFIDN